MFSLWVYGISFWFFSQKRRGMWEKKKKTSKREERKEQDGKGRGEERKKKEKERRRKMMMKKKTKQNKEMCRSENKELTNYILNALPFLTSHKRETMNNLCHSQDCSMSGH